MNILDLLYCEFQLVTNQRKIANTVFAKNVALLSKINPSAVLISGCHTT